MKKIYQFTLNDELSIASVTEQINKKIASLLVYGNEEHVLVMNRIDKENIFGKETHYQRIELKTDPDVPVGKIYLLHRKELPFLHGATQAIVKSKHLLEGGEK